MEKKRISDDHDSAEEVNASGRPSRRAARKNQRKNDDDFEGADDEDDDMDEFVV